MSIPASNIVRVTPGVLSAGGNGLVLNGLILSLAATLPIGAPVSFPNALSVSEYFGPNATETAMAATYFSGYNNGTLTPGALLISRYADADKAAFIRGGANPSTLDALKAITAGGLVMTIDGVVVTLAAIDLHTAVSFSGVAALITTALSTSGSCTYSSQFDAFTITSATTGATSTITVATGTVGIALGLTLAKGAVLSQGADEMTPTSAMNAVIGFTVNWAAFATTFQATLGDMTLFSNWTSAQAGEYAYICYDGDVVSSSTHADTDCFGYLLTASGNSGTCLIGCGLGLTSTLPKVAAFILGTIASLDFNRTNGRITFKFKSNNSVSPSVTDATSAANLESNGYNYYGQFATAADGFILFSDGHVSGPYGFLDAYINALWLNSEIQLAILTGFMNSASVPYNNAGYATIQAWAADPIKRAVSYGAIRSGVQLSAAQIANVNQAAGVAIAPALFAQGWYFQVKPATAEQRAARQSPACTLWYTDGGSVHTLNVASIDVQ